MIVGLIIWCAACLIFYIVASLIENSQKKGLIQSGVAITKNISTQSGLALLEGNINQLSRLIEEATERPEVVFASIIDHKNKLIAYTDQEQFFTLNHERSGKIDDVDYWRITGLSHQRVMNFSSEITFSGTRVGEVFISIAAEKMNGVKQLFSFFGMISLLILVATFVLTKYKVYSPWWKVMGMAQKPSGKAGQDQQQEFTCLLCGHPQEGPLNGFEFPDLEKKGMLTRSKDLKKTTPSHGNVNDKELKQFKKNLIVQCAKIINKTVSE